MANYTMGITSHFNCLARNLVYELNPIYMNPNLFLMLTRLIMKVYSINALVAVSADGFGDTPTHQSFSHPLYVNFKFWY